MAQCFHCKAESTPEHYQRVVHNHVALYGPWRGWRMAGRVLVSPDGDRITPERLRGILFGEKFRIRKPPALDPPQTVVSLPAGDLPARERFEGAA